MSGLREIGPSVALPGSPVATLRALAGAALADDSVPCACPHPGTASRLHLPSRILACDDCDHALQNAADQAQPLTCAACGATATRTTCWLAGQILVIAKLCAPCQMTGNMPASLN